MKNRTLTRGEAELIQAEEAVKHHLEEGPWEEDEGVGGQDGDARQAGGQQGRYGPLSW